MTVDPPPAPAPRDAVELTRRAIVTGMVLGAALTPCNVYSGLKIGWSFNMSIAAGLLGAGLWGLAGRAGAGRPIGLLENNINQTTASSAASIISGGLVAPIPALSLLTGQALSWPVLAFWVFAVSLLGVVVAAGLRRQMIEREALRFPAGVATAETMTQIHGSGAEAGARLKVLLAAASVAAALKVALDLFAAVPRLALGVALPATAALRAALPGGATLSNLTFAFDPSLLMIGFGAIIGLRAGLSLLAGAVVAWGVLAPLALARGWAEAGAPEAVWFEPLVTWLLWPGVALIVVSALVSFALSVARYVVRRRSGGEPAPARTARPTLYYVAFLAAATALVAVAATTLFGLALWEALLAVALSYVLAVVAARVTGETGVTPIGALGKITQLAYGLISPGNVTTNLMTANVTGGAAGQCADLMHDLRTGQLIGATPRFQIVAQCFGVLTGSLVGAYVYLVLIPDPVGMLITPQWPAPAVATWKAVAEVLAQGLGAIPDGALPAMAIAAALGVVVPGLAARLPARYGRWLPSAPAFGLAFVIPAWNSMSLCLGAVLAALLARAAPDWARRRTITLAAGLVAGESLAGVALAFASLAG